MAERVHVALIQQLILLQLGTPESSLTLLLKGKNETQHGGEVGNISFILPVPAESKVLQCFWQIVDFSVPPLTLFTQLLGRASSCFSSQQYFSRADNFRVTTERYCVQVTPLAQGLFLLSHPELHAIKRYFALSARVKGT